MIKFMQVAVLGEGVYRRYIIKAHRFTVLEIFLVLSYAACTCYPYI